MTSPRLYVLAAVRTITRRYKLYASPVTAVAALFTAGLTIINGVFMHVITRAFARCIAGVAPLIHCIEARTVALVTVRAAFHFKIEDIGVGFGTVAVMSRSAAFILFSLSSADTDTAAVAVISRRFLRDWIGGLS